MTESGKRYAVIVQVEKRGAWLREDLSTTMTELVDRYGWASACQLRWLKNKDLDTKGEFFKYARDDVEYAVILEVTSLDFVEWCLLSGDSVEIINDESHG